MNTKRTILAVDDSIDDLKQIINMLEDSFIVLFATDGRKAVELAFTEKPDLILLDIVMPGMDGFETCKKLKSYERTRDIPIVFLTGSTDDDTEAKGFEVGAADFITKPIRPSIIHARLKNHLHLRSTMEELRRLYSLALDANPMTGLPGNNSVSSAIEASLAERAATCVIYTDIDNFKAFNDKYGFARGDEVLLFTARILQASLDKQGRNDDFLGHVGGDDFVIITPSRYSQPIGDNIISAFESGVVKFYNEEDRAERCIKSIDRKGKPQTFPIMSISIAGVDLSHRKYRTYLEVNDVCTEIKKRAKRTEGSCFYLDQRSPASMTAERNHEQENGTRQRQNSTGKNDSTSLPSGGN